jgi:hypothetical protein
LRSRRTTNARAEAVSSEEIEMRRLLAALLLSQLAIAPYRSAAAELAVEAPPATVGLTQSEVQANDYLAWLQEQMRRMDTILEKVRRSESRHERRDLLRQYATALRVANALTNAVDPSLGIFGSRRDPRLGSKRLGRDKKMDCPMMGAKGPPREAPPAPEAEHESHH